MSLTNCDTFLSPLPGNKLTAQARKDKLIPYHSMKSSVSLLRRYNRRGSRGGRAIIIKLKKDLISTVNVDQNEFNFCYIFCLLERFKVFLHFQIAERI